MTMAVMHVNLSVDPARANGGLLKVRIEYEAMMTKDTLAEELKRFGLTECKEMEG